jgi:DNA-binding NtrC family response regulator
LRELRNAIRRIVLLATSSELDEEDLKELSVSSGNETIERLRDVTDDMLPLAKRLRQATNSLESEILGQTLAACEGNKAAAARALQIDYTTLHRKLKRHGIIAP